MSSDNDDEEIYAVEHLCCTVCEHDLNHSIYLLCEHPVLLTPVCIICRDNVQQSELFDESEDLSDYCTWCASGGDLLLCDNADCNRAFCKECVWRNFGADFVSSIEESESWKCFCCDDHNKSLLQPFITALEDAQPKSVYNLPLAEFRRGNDTACAESSDSADNEEEIQRALFLLQKVVEESNRSIGNLEIEAQNERMCEIRDEYRLQNTDTSQSVHVLALEELQTWKDYWTRHCDILQTQEAALFDHLYALGCDPRQFDDYTASYERLTQNLSAKERDAKRTADQAITLSSASATEHSASSPGLAVATNSFGSSLQDVNKTHSSPAKKSKKTVKYVEEVEEIDSENKLPGYQLQALQDEIVLKYAAQEAREVAAEESEESRKEESTVVYEDVYKSISRERYPASFAAVTPLSVIKAYFHASSKERKELAARYSMPPHMCIILAALSTHRDFPYNTDKWSFAATVHPAVRLALYYSESTTQTAILCEHYQLGDEFCQVTDFGAPAELISVYKASLKERNAVHKRNKGETQKQRFTSREIEDAEEYQEENELKLMKELCLVVANGSSTSSATAAAGARRRERMQQLLQPVLIDDADDEKKYQKERRRAAEASGVARRSKASHHKHHDSTSGNRAVLSSKASKRGADQRMEVENTEEIACSATVPADTGGNTGAGGGLDQQEILDGHNLGGFDDSGDNAALEGPMDVEPTGASADQNRESAGPVQKPTERSTEPEELPDEGDGGPETEHESDSEKYQEGSVEEPEEGQGEGHKKGKKKRRRPGKGKREQLRLEGKYPHPPADAAASTSAQAPPYVHPAHHAAYRAAQRSRDDDIDVIEVIDDSNKGPPGTHHSLDNEGVIDLCSDSDPEPGNSGPNQQRPTSAFGALFTPKLPPKHVPPVQHQPVRAKIEASSSSAQHFKIAKPTAGAAGGSKIMSAFLTSGAPSSRLTGNIKAEPLSVDSDVDSDVFDIDDEKDTDAAGFKRLRPGPKGIGAPSAKKPKKSTDKSDNHIWSKETKLVMSAERKRRKELLSHVHFNEEDGFALNSKRPKEDSAVVIIEHFKNELKDHQKEGLRFIWENVMGSVSNAAQKADSGSGCILAHCMGLGKTLTVIAFTATLFTNPIICSIEDPYQPKSPPPAAATSSSSSATTAAAATEPAAAASHSVADSAGQEKPTNAASTAMVVDEPLPAVPSVPPPVSTSTNNAANAQPSESQSSTLSESGRKKSLIHTVLIVAPKNTLDNWINEYKRWTPEELHGYTNVSCIQSIANQKGSWEDRLRRLHNWHKNGGVMVMGYEMFRILTNLDNSKAKNHAAAATSATASGARSSSAAPPPSSSVTLENITEGRRYLQNPGPDLVVADEAHIIKEKTSRIATLMKEIRTKRRIALTGSPLQNNLLEYWCMIDWVKNRFLGGYKEFLKYYVLPIKDGSSINSTSTQVRKMKQRTHLLNNKLLPVVNRKDMSALEKDLKPKREFVISVKMTPFQKFLYRYFLTLLNELDTRKKLLIGYNCLQRVWNHPGCTVLNYHKITTQEDRKATKALLAESATAIAISSKPTVVATSASSLKIAGSSAVDLTTEAGPATAIHAVSSASAFDALRNSSAVKPPSKTKAKPATKCSLQDIREEIDNTFRHFSRQDQNALDKMEKSAALLENELLSKSTAAANGPFRSERNIDDFAHGDEMDTDGGPRTLHELQDSDGDCSNDSGGYHSALDSYDDGDGFVVDDDFVEYEDDSDYSDPDCKAKKSKRRHNGARKADKSTRKVSRKSPTGEDGKASGPSSSAEHKRRRISDSGEEREAAAEAIEDIGEVEYWTAPPISMQDRTMDGVETPSVSTSAERQTDSVERSVPTSITMPTALSLSTPCVKVSPLQDDATAEAPAYGGASDSSAGSSSRTSPTDDATTPLGDAVSEQRLQELEAALLAEDAVKRALTQEGEDPAGAEKVEAEIEALTMKEIKFDWWTFPPPPDTTSDADAAGCAVDGSGFLQARATKPLLDNLALLKLSNKMVTLLSLLALSVLEGDKMLVFSQSLYSLDMIELFLGMNNWGRLIDCVQEKLHERRKFSEWSLGTDYLRIDGSSSQRQKTIDTFNRDSRMKLMLISTKAGNMGINLQAANRVVIFDTSWNPVHDLQAMYRAYRYGQKKSVFVYRLLSAGSMEEKIYRLQVKKQSLSARVVDAQMPDNHFTEEELMSFDDCDGTNEVNKAQPLLESESARDGVLSTFVQHFAAEVLVSIEDHGGLLADKPDEHLNEHEQAQARLDLEKEMGMQDLQKRAELAHQQAMYQQGTALPITLPNGTTVQIVGGYAPASAAAPAPAAKGAPPYVNGRPPTVYELSPGGGANPIGNIESYKSTPGSTPFVISPAGHPVPVVASSGTTSSNPKQVTKYVINAYGRGVPASSALTPAPAPAAPLVASETTPGDATAAATQQDAQTREDKLILFCQTVNSDPGYTLTSQVLQNSLGVVRTPEQVWARHQDLQQSGRAQELLQIPNLAEAIAKHKSEESAPASTAPN